MNPCYPIIELILDSPQSCKHDWKMTEVIGTDGTYGEVWAVCCQDDCNHALKYMPYDDVKSGRQNTKEDIINEMKLQQTCAEKGLCPFIKQAWMCRAGGAIVMDLYDVTVRQLLTETVDINVHANILAYVLALVDKLHRHGIYHGDLHLDNVMVNKKLNKYQFIDLGKGGTFTNMDDIHIQDDYIEIASHIQDMTFEYPDHKFDKLYETMKIHLTKFD